MKLLTILIFFILTINVYGDDPSIRNYSINDFSKGLNSHANIYSTSKNQANSLQNVRFNQKFGSLAKRNIMVQYGTVGSHSVTGLYRYYKSTGEELLIATGSTNMYLGDDAAGTFQTLQSDLSDGKRWQFVTYQDILIGINGADQPMKYDGHTQVTADTDGSRTASNLLAELGAPFAELNTGANLDASSWYQYKIAFYDGVTYTYSDARSNAILTGATVRDITLTDIPLGPAGTTNRYVYRTVGNASKAAVEADTSFYLVTNIADNTTRTYNDTNTDATILADNPPTWATVSAGVDATAPVGKYIVINKERIFISGNPTNQSDVYWSGTFAPEHFEQPDFEQIRPDDGDKITFMKILLGTLIIGKSNSIIKFYSEGSTVNWSISDPFSFIGCHAPYSATVTPLGLFYLNKKGLYKFNGQSSMLLSDIVTTQIRDINRINLVNAWGEYLNNEYHLAYNAITTGSQINDRILVYNLIRQSYTLDTKSVNCMAAFNAGNDSGSIYFGSSDTDGKIYSEQEEIPDLIINTKSELDAGTFDDTATHGDDNNPTLDISWDITIASAVGTIAAQTGIVARPDTNGTWESPVYEVNASALDRLFWNENLQATGDITWQLKTGATVAATIAASYGSSYSNPQGSDISGETARKYIRFKSSLSTTDISVSPELIFADGFIFKMLYSGIGSTEESDVLSIWQSGFGDFGVSPYEKQLRRIRVYYQGDSGSLEVNMKNLISTIDTTFTIDLSISPDTATDDNYKGTDEYKIYTYYPETDTIGQHWQFTITEEGTENWQVDKIEMNYGVEEDSEI